MATGSGGMSPRLAAGLGRESGSCDGSGHESASSREIDVKFGRSSRPVGVSGGAVALATEPLLRLRFGYRGICGAIGVTWPLLGVVPVTLTG
jgi:hypothetical protein